VYLLDGLLTRFFKVGTLDDRYRDPQATHREDSRQM
jgi:hypothetical protein